MTPTRSAPATGDQGRLTGAGGENLFGVDPGPAPQGDPLPVGQRAVLDHERGLGSLRLPARAVKGAGSGYGREDRAGAGQEALAFVLIAQRHSGLRAQHHPDMGTPGPVDQADRSPGAPSNELHSSNRTRARRWRGWRRAA